MLQSNLEIERAVFFARLFERAHCIARAHALIVGCHFPASAKTSVPWRRCVGVCVCVQVYVCVCVCVCVWMFVVCVCACM